VVNIINELSEARLHRELMQAERFRLRPALLVVFSSFKLHSTAS
jgi:hypothetical protein